MEEERQFWGRMATLLLGFRPLDSDNIRQYIHNVVTHEARVWGLSTELGKEYSA